MSSPHGSQTENIREHTQTKNVLIFILDGQGYGSHVLNILAITEEEKKNTKRQQYNSAA